MSKIKRYRLAIFENTEVRKIENSEYITKLEKLIKNYNRNEKNPFVLGEINIDNNLGIVTFKKYRKITFPSTLEEIDLLSLNFIDDSQFKEYYKVSQKNSFPIEIIYKTRNQIRNLPVLYKKDLRFINHDYSKSIFTQYGTNMDFLSKLIANNQIKSSVRSSASDYEKLYIQREKLKYCSQSELSTYPMKSFFESFIKEGGSFNYYNFRLLCLELIKFNEIIELQEEIAGQITLEEVIDEHERKLKLGHKMTK